MSYQVFSFYAYPRILNDQGLNEFPPQEVRFSQGQRFFHGWVQIENNFYLPGIDIKAAGNDHPFFSAPEKNIAVGVDGGQIARVKPAVADYLRRGFGIMV